MDETGRDNPLGDDPLETRNTFPPGQHVWVWKVFSTKKNPKGCATWTGPWKILGPVLEEQDPAQQWRMIGSLFDDVVPLQTVKQGRYLWPFHLQDIYHGNWVTKTISYSLESHGNFMEIQPGEGGPGDLKLEECLATETDSSFGLSKLLLKRDDTERCDRLSALTAADGYPKESQRPPLGSLSDDMKKLTVGSRSAVGNPASWDREPWIDYPLVHQPSHDNCANTATPFYHFLENETHGGHYEDHWSTVQTNQGGPRQHGSIGGPALVFDRPPPPYPIRIKAKQPPAGYSFSSSWYRNLSGLRPVIRGTQTVRHYQEVLVEHVKVRAVIDDNITVGLASRAFLATLAVYLPKIPVPVLLGDNQDVPPDVVATYITISSQVRGTKNSCIHPVLVAPSLGGEKLVLGVAYLKDNVVEGYQAYLQTPTSNQETAPQTTPPAWWQAAQDQVYNQYHYTPDWSGTQQ